jgi:hypothetical protein
LRDPMLRMEFVDPMLHRECVSAMASSCTGRHSFFAQGGRDIP